MSCVSHMTTCGYRFSNHGVIPGWKLIFKVAQYALIFIISVISSNIEYWPEQRAEESVQLQVLDRRNKPCMASECNYQIVYSFIHPALQTCLQVLCHLLRWYMLQGVIE